MKETRGRKKIADKDKVKTSAVYLRSAEVDKIKKKYGTVTEAIRRVVLPTI